jgi:hypothetical protein
LRYKKNFPIEKFFCFNSGYDSHSNNAFFVFKEKSFFLKINGDFVFLRVVETPFVFLALEPLLSVFQASNSTCCLLGRPDAVVKGARKRTKTPTTFFVTVVVQLNT